MAERWFPLVLLDASVWIALSIAVGAGASRAPDRWFEADNALTRMRRFERQGAFWDRRLRVRKWKESLPEAGAFAGGFSKRRLRFRDDLRRHAVATRRGEMVHWVLLAAGPSFLLWNPAALALIMIAFAIAANTPCIVVLRFNRARLLRAIERSEGVARRWTATSI